MRDEENLFTKKEFRYLHDTDFLLSKRIITDKLFKQFHQLTKALKASPPHRNFIFPAGTDFQTGKISRGENYKGLPYVILDFPRLFEKENVFAFRTMCWWGNYFSFTLHLKGKLLEQYRNSIIAHLPEIKKDDVLIYTGQDEWEHDLSDKHFVTLEKKSGKVLKEINSIKLVKKSELKDCDLLLEKGVDAYSLFLSLLG